MNFRKRKAKLLAQATLRAWNRGSFGDAYFERYGQSIVDAVERAIKNDVWWRRILRRVKMIK